jgi:hypothetical protein
VLQEVLTRALALVADPRVWSTGGLVLDALGAACLLRPILSLSRAEIRQQASMFWKEQILTESGLGQLRWAKIGLVLLLLGSALQIVGTWLPK